MRRTKTALAEAIRREAEAAEASARSARRLQRLRLAADAVPVGLVVSDETGAELFRNEWAAELLDSGPGGVLVRHALGSVMASARDGHPAEQTLELMGPPVRTVDVRSEVIADGTEHLGSVGVIQDLTERRQLEATRRDFVANMSHELRTPVGALAALAEAMVDEPDKDVMRRLARRVVDEAERATRIIEDLLDLSRIETEPPASRPLVRISSIVVRAAERVEAAAAEYGTRLLIPEVGESLTVRGNENQLVSAVANLLDNAVKYSGPGSTVELNVRTIPGEVRLAVRDEGIGIPSKDHERIFERFYRVDPARSRSTGGTGLGLAIVRHVAINHGGRVLVESREGEGSTFTLVLPDGSP